MRAGVTHINLLQRSGPRAVVALSMLVILGATISGLIYYAGQTSNALRVAQGQRDGVAKQIKQVQAALAAQTGEQVRRASSVALRAEVQALEPAAYAAQALVDAFQGSGGGRAEEFSRVLGALTGLNEPGLWLTNMGISSGGKKLEVQGEARSGDAVLRYARRANESLKPLALRLDTLEMSAPVALAAPAAALAGAAGTAAPAAAAATFKLF